MKLRQGQQAPHFRLKDVFGRIIDLNDYADRRVFLGFFRHAGCPFCNLRVHALLKVHPELKALGMEMIFFFESKESIILRSTFHKAVSPIPLMSDPEKAYYRAYGVESSAMRSAVSHVTSFIPTVIKAKSAGVPVHMMAGNESINTMPAEFLLGKHSIIHKALYAESLNDRLALDEVLTFARAPHEPVSI